MNNFWHHYTTVIPKLLNGVSVTLEITFFAVMIGIVIGMFMALGKMSRHLWLKIPANIYIECLRGTPLFVQIFLFHYGVSSVIKEIIGAPFAFQVMTTAIVVCGLNSGAYVAEIFRAGIQSVDKGQMEAARSLGMSHGKAMFYVVLPQAFKQAIPPLGNEFVILLKDTSLLAAIGATEIMKIGQIYTSVHFAPFPTYVGVATVYLVLTFAITRFVNWTERKLNAGDNHLPTRPKTKRQKGAAKA